MSAANSPGEYPPRRRGSIRTRLLSINLALGVIPVLTGILLFVIVRTALQQDTENTAKQLASTIALQTANLLEGQTSNMEVLAASVVLRSPNVPVEDRIDRLERFVRDNNVYVGVEVLNLDGQRVASWGDTRGGLAAATVDPATRWFDSALQGNTAVSDMYYLRPASQPVITFAAPLYSLDESNEVVGVVAAHMDPDVLSDTVNAIPVGRSGYAVVVNSEGRIVSERDPGLLLNDLSSNETVRRAMLSVGGGAARATAYDSSTMMLYGYVPVAGSESVSDLDWTVLALRPVDEVQSLETTILLVTIGVIVMGLVLSSFLSVAAAARLTEPILLLHDAAIQVSQGDLDTPLLVETNDEIEGLSEALVQMVRNLRAALARVQNRERALIATAEISRQATTAHQVDELLLQAVELIRDTFGYYHVHAYLLDQTSSDLVMRAGSGSIGRELRSMGHRLPSGRGIVGRVGTSGESFLAPDTRQIDFWAPNPLLSETRAELAVPIRSAQGRVIGVLDAQSEVVGGFSPEDEGLMLSLADQLAVAIENWELVRGQQRAYERQRILNIIYEQIQQATSLDEVLQTATRELGMALNAENTSVYIGLSQDGDADNGSEVGHD